MGAGPALSFEGFGFSYRRGGDRPALRDLDLDVGEGEAVCLMGRTGAGKTTLCSAVNGVVPRLLRGEATGGVRVLGEAVSARRVPEWAGSVGVVFQDFETQIFSTEVSLEVAFGLENLGLAPEEIRRRVPACLHRVGLEALAKRSPATLSGGEKQRLVLASVLAQEPRVLVLDEPTTDLDPAAKAELFALVEQLAREGRTLLLAEHEPEALRFTGRAAVLEVGRLAREGSARRLRADSGWMLGHGLAPDPVAELWRRLGLGGSPDGAAEAGAELRRMGARLAPPRSARSAGEAVLALEGVGVTYPGGVRALAEVDLEIREGEILAVLGPNGSGKTTLARVLAGLQPPTSGRLLRKGASGASHAHVGRVGLVFQEPDDQIFATTVLEEVSSGPRAAGLGEEEARARTAEAIQAVGLSGSEEADPFALPKGERQKVAVASVLATGPTILVLDEPTTGLDRRALEGMLVLMRRLRDEGHAVVMITHSMGIVASEADRVVVLSGGRVRAEGPPREVFADRRLVDSARLRMPEVLEICAALDGPPALTVEELSERLVLPGRERAGSDG